MKISDDKLHGRVVLSGDGIAIGDVSKLFIEGAQFSISSIEVKLRKEISERLGIERSLWHGASVELPASAVRSVGDAVLLTLTLDEVRAASVNDLGADTRQDPRDDAGDRRADTTQGGLVDARSGEAVGTPREGTDRGVDVRELREAARPHPPR